MKMVVAACLVSITESLLLDVRLVRNPVLVHMLASRDLSVNDVMATLIGLCMMWSCGVGLYVY